MMVLGITILFNKKLDIVSKFIFSGAGFWLPVALISMTIFGKTTSSILYPGIYNALMWALIGYLAFKTTTEFEYAGANEVRSSPLRQS